MAKGGRIAWFPTDAFRGPATRAAEGRPTLRRRALDDLDPRLTASPSQAWECGDCGWNVTAAELLPGWSLEHARLTHWEKYCARPPAWTPR